MTEKRFQWVYIKDNTLELRDNGIVKIYNNERLEELLNEQHEENEQLKQQCKDFMEMLDDMCIAYLVNDGLEEILMTENVMYICGLSMEMENAREMGYVGKCIGCLHNLIYIDGDRRELLCEKKGKVKERTNCKDWVVDHR